MLTFSFHTRSTSTSRINLQCLLYRLASGTHTHTQCASFDTSMGAYSGTWSIPGPHLLALLSSSMVSEEFLLLLLLLTLPLLLQLQWPHAVALCSDYGNGLTSSFCYCCCVIEVVFVIFVVVVVIVMLTIELLLLLLLLLLPQLTPPAATLCRVPLLAADYSDCRIKRATLST